MKRGIDVKKKYINVSVEFSIFGEELPKDIIWSKENQFEIDKVLHVCEAAEDEFSGKRYTVRIGNSERDIYRDDGGWYIDAEKVRLYG
jgi:hypothetical protein